MQGVLTPLASVLRNDGGPQYRLRDGDSEDLCEEGHQLEMNDLPDNVAPVGRVWFHAPSRGYANPPAGSLREFVQSNPDAPVYVVDGKEVPHVVFAQPTFVGKDDTETIRLFTKAVGHQGAFPHATHQKNGVQYTGVEILDWNMVDFDQPYYGNTARRVWVKVWKEIGDMAE